MIKFSDEHVWLRLDDPVKPDLATIGITEHAQETLGDIVFVDLPPIGKLLERTTVAAVVESVKAAADVFMPASGKVLEVNEALRDDPSLINSQAMSGGWMFKVQLTQQAELSTLMDESAYAEFLKTV
jgi:glycine cleavage system H protein